MWREELKRDPSQLNEETEQVLSPLERSAEITSPSSLGREPSFSSHNTRSFLQPESGELVEVRSLEVGTRRPRSFLNLRFSESSINSAPGHIAVTSLFSNTRSYLEPEIVGSSVGSPQSGTEVMDNPRSYIEPEVLGSDGSSPDSSVMMVQNTRTFQEPLTDSSPIGSVSYATRSFLLPESARGSKNSTPSLLALNDQSNSECTIGHNSSTSILPVNQSSRPTLALEFVEFNGMMELAKRTTDLQKYLQKRVGWIGMVLYRGVAKTIRLDHTVSYITNGGLDGGKTFAIVKRSYAEQYRSRIGSNLAVHRPHSGDVMSRKRKM
jgi:hypothetical protein